MGQFAPQGSLFDGIMPYIRKTGMFALTPVNSENPHIFRASGDVDTDEETSHNLYGYERFDEAQMQPRAKLTVKVGTRAVSTRWRTSDDETKSGTRRLCPHEDCFNGSGERWWCAQPATYVKHMNKKHGGA